LLLKAVRAALRLRHLDPPPGNSTSEEDFNLGFIRNEILQEPLIDLILERIHISFVHEVTGAIFWNSLATPLHVCRLFL
jgi:hypothetical protein